MAFRRGGPLAWHGGLRDRHVIDLGLVREVPLVAVVLQWTLVATVAPAALLELWTSINMPLLALFSERTISSIEVDAYAGISVDVHVSIRTSVAGASSTDKEHADGHLQSTQAMRERAIGHVTLALEESLADGDLVRIVDVGTAVALVTFTAFAKLVVEHAEPLRPLSLHGQPIDASVNDSIGHRSQLLSRRPDEDPRL